MLEFKAPRCTWQFGKEAELSHQLLLLWPQSEGHKLHLNLPESRFSSSALTDTSNQISEPKDVFRPAASMFILMPCQRDEAATPLFLTSLLFGQTLQISATLVAALQKLEESDVFFLFSEFLSQRLSCYVRIIVRQEKSKRKTLLNDQLEM